MDQNYIPCCTSISNKSFGVFDVSVVCCECAYGHGDLMGLYNLGDLEYEVTTLYAMLLDRTIH